MGSVWDPGEEDTSRSFCSSRTPNPWWSGCLPPSLCCKRLASFGWLPKSIYRKLRINDMHQTGFESGVGPCLGTGALAKGLRRLESGDCPRKHPRVSALLRGSGHKFCANRTFARPHRLMLHVREQHLKNNYCLPGSNRKQLRGGAGTLRQ